MGIATTPLLHRLRAGLAGAALALCGTSAMATAPLPVVLNFDNLPGAGLLGSYGGFDFTGWMHYDTDQQGLPYFAHSPDTRIYAPSNVNDISSALPFVFEGAWMSGYATAKLHYEMYLQGSLVALSPTYTPDAVTSQWLPSGYGGSVDRLVVVSAQPNYFVLDDLTVSAAPLQGPVPAVPEGSTASLMLAGLGAVVVMGYRRGAQARLRDAN